MRRTAVQSGWHPARHAAPLGQRVSSRGRRVRGDPRRGRRPRGDAGRRAHRHGIAAIDAGEGHRLRASFGVALGDGAPDPEALLRAADAAMYEAKRAGEGVRFAVVTST